MELLISGIYTLTYVAAVFLICISATDTLISVDIFKGSQCCYNDF
jgi:hypothetical protein